MKFSYFKVFVILVVTQVNDGLLPPSIVPCRRNDPNISDCIVKAINNISPKFANGDLGGGFIVPQLEPFYIKEVSFGDEKALKVHVDDLYIRGASRFKIEKLRANPLDLKFDAISVLPQIDITGKYKMSLVFLGAPVTSTGEIFVTFNDAKIKMSMKGNKYTKNGVQHIKFDPFGIKFNRGTTKNLKITNLFGGNKVLGEIVHSLLLNNPDYLLKSFYPSLEPQLSRHFTGIANKVVEYSSYDEMFPV